MKPQTNAALLRKIARLEAQLKDVKEFMQRDRTSEFNTIMELADFRERHAQAIELLSGRFDA